MALSTVTPFAPPPVKVPPPAPSGAMDRLTENKAPKRSNTFTWKAPVAPPAPAAPPSPPLMQSPIMQTIETAYAKDRYPDIQRPMSPESVTKIRQNYGGNDDLVMMNLYKKDPTFRAEVDRYSQGEMMNLSQDAQNHFPSFILNSHYFNDPSAELPANMDITKDPTRKGDGTWANWISHVLTAPATVAAGGVATAAQGVIDDLTDVYHLATGQKFDFNDSDQLAWYREVQSILDPNYSFESTVQTAATQAQIGASMMGPLGYPIAAAAGAARDVAGARMQGEDPSLLGDVAAGAAKGLASQYIGNKMAPLKVTPANPATIAGRIVNAGVKGAIVAPAITGTTGAIDAATGEKTVGEAAMETAMSIPLGALTGAGIQGAMEAPNIVRAGYSKLTGFSRLSSAKQYQLAVEHGGAEAKTAMAKGVAPKDTVILTDASPEERGIYQNLHAVAKDKLFNPRSTSNMEQAQGKLGMDKLRSVIEQQNVAGKALGDIRTQLSTKPNIDVNVARNGFVDFLGKMGISTVGNKLGVENSILEPSATSALKMAWANLPKEGVASQSQIDDIIQTINQVIQATDIDESAARMGMGALKQNLRTALADSLDDTVKPQYLSATQAYANTMDVLREAKKALPYTGRMGAQYSLHQFKKDALSGELDLRMGQLVRGLASRTEGMRSPFFNALEDMTDNQVYVTRPDGTQYLASNQKLGPFATKTFDAKLQNVAEYTERLDQMLGLQKPAGLSGQMKGTSSNMQPANWLKNISNLFKVNSEDVFRAQDDYLNALQANHFTPVIDVNGATVELMKAGEMRRSELVKQLQHSRQQGIGENRLTHFTGQNEGVSGLDFPETPAQAPGTPPPLGKTGAPQGAVADSKNTPLPGGRVPAKTGNGAKAPQASTIPEKTSGVNSNMFDDFANLSPDEIASLTPEERATGLIGGSDSIDVSKLTIPSASDSKAVLDYSSKVLGTTPDKIAAVVKKAGSDTNAISKAVEEAFPKYKPFMDAVMNGDLPMQYADFADPLRRAVFGNTSPTP